ncbi:MAG: hypothetical protein Q4G48_01770, partial [Bacteroidia bacterium]|nr:hypothetical protein [Bacteroidia bacterium]
MNITFLVRLGINAAFFFFLFFPLPAQEVIDSAQYRAVYNFSYKTKPDQTEYAKTDLMYLDIGQKATKFYSRYEQIRDSVMFDGLDRKLSIYEVNDNRRQYTKGSRKIYYHLFDEKRIIVSDMFTARNYVY